MTRGASAVNATQRNAARVRALAVGLQNMLLMLTIAFGVSVDQNHDAIVDLD